MPTKSAITRGRRFAILFLLTAVVLPFLSSCGNKTDHKVLNRNPFVRLTGGPVQKAPGSTDKDSVSYTSEFLWTGWDEDGIIDHYQYAMDIPDELLNEINNPLPTGIAWKDTTAFRARFRFSATIQDTILDPFSGTITLPNQYRGDHTFYVRAVDNEGGVSEASHVTFTARTTTPQTTFTSPKVATTNPILQVGRQFNVAWQGVDPDNPDPRKLPAYYEWKLISGFYAQTIGDVNYSVNVNPGPNFPWHRVGADTTHLTLNLDTHANTDYIFAVRAIDEAGGVEGKFFLGQNAILLSPSDRNPGTPSLTIKEKTAGSFQFPGQVWEIETAVGHCLRFDFEATAEAYGGIIQGYNYGVDVPDVDADGPTSGFKGWTLIKFTYDPICFNVPGVHALTVKVRDTGGGITVATVIIRVVAFPLDREVLYVDDFRKFKDGAVTDGMMDQMAVEMLTSIGIPADQVYEFDTFGVNDVAQNPTGLKLSDLSRYKTILWSVHGVGYSQNPALSLAAACETGRILQAYVGAGGSILVYGQKAFGAFKRYGPPNSACLGTVGYGENNSSTGLFFNPGSFPADYLGLPGGDIRTVSDDVKKNGIIRVKPTAKAAAAQVPFPPMEIDSVLFNNVAAVGGVYFVDAMFQPTYAAGLDSVYQVEKTAKSASTLKDRYVAFRYADPDPVPSQGPVAVFGFPLHFFKQGEASKDPITGLYHGTGVKGMAAAVWAWFAQNGPPARAALSPQSQ